ncbi:hypothetical protein [Nocardia xishanensis]|uniref:hypothetical protein n=1 Tax=Nocardia xishanensis TaxID=238964 RepID=UPI000834FCF4|nr:hypothetical protein [Nocardia xishanensis]
MTAPAIPADIVGACHYLRTVGGLPCHVDNSNRIAVTIGGTIRALTVPDYWGARIKDKLAEFGLKGPTIWHPFHRMTFLTGSYDHSDHSDRTATVIRRSGSVLIEPGTPLYLPAPGEESRRWQTPVRDLFRPTMASVLDALVYCVEEERR